jgi:hypothetical protein
MTFSVLNRSKRGLVNGGVYGALEFGAVRWGSRVLLLYHVKWGFVTYLGESSQLTNMISVVESSFGDLVILF